MSSSLPLHGALGQMQRRLASVVLVGQAPVIFFGALTLWGLAKAQQDPRATAFLVVGSVVAVLSILCAGLLKRPFGVTIGWLVQLVIIGTAFLAPVALVVAAIFTSLWVTALYQGRKMDALTAERDRVAGPV